MVNTKNKHDLRELIIWAVIAGGLIGLVFYRLNPNVGQETYAPCKQKAEHIYENAIQEVPQGVEPGVPSRPKIDKTRKEADQKHLENIVLCSDLHAQQAMSNRAHWGLFIGICGLIVLWITLLQTQRAARAASSTLEVARDATKAEFQPYISVHDDIDMTLVDLNPENPESSDWCAQINRFEIKNIGKTPASDVQTEGTGKFYKDGQHFEASVTVSGLKKGDFVSGQTWVWECEIPFECSKDENSRPEGMSKMDISISIIFTDMFSDEKEREYEFHYQYYLADNSASLQSITEKTPKQGLRS